MMHGIALHCLIAVAVSGGIAYAFISGPALQTMTLIHASGGASSVRVCGAATQLPPPPSTGAASTTGGTTSTPAATTTTVTTPSAQTSPALMGLPVGSQSSGGPTAAGAIAGGGAGVAPSGGAELNAQYWSRPAGGGITGPLFGGPEPKYKAVEVTGAGGQAFPARRISSGVHNELRLRTGGGIVHLWLGDIESITFGEKELARLHVSVVLSDGSEMEGTIYPGAVFEFEGAGQPKARRAEDISGIAFISD